MMDRLNQNALRAELKPGYDFIEELKPPRITTSNIMAPCVVIGERAAELIRGTQSRSPALASP
jgi:hypothetical protein